MTRHATNLLHAVSLTTRKITVKIFIVNGEGIKTLKKISIFLTIIISFLIICACSHQELYEEEKSYIVEHEAINDYDSTLRFARQTDNGTIWTLWQRESYYAVRKSELDGLNSNISDFEALFGDFVAEFDSDDMVVGFVATDEAVSILTQEDNVLTLTQVDMFASELFEVSVDFMEDVEVHVISMLSDNNGWIYIAWNAYREALHSFQSGVTVITDTGSLLFTLSGRYNITGLSLVYGSVMSTMKQTVQSLPCIMLQKNI